MLVDWAEVYFSTCVDPGLQLCLTVLLCVDQVQVFVQAWTAQGKSVVEKLRSRTFYPKQVLSY